MRPRIDYASLDLRAALDLAILIEEDAQLRYEEFTRRVTDPGALAFFKEMAGNEAKHRQQLLARRDVLFRKGPRVIDTSLVDGAEAPGPNEVEDAITVREAMEVALAAEIRAFEFYDQALPHLKDADVRAFFEELKGEEVEHQAMLRKKIAQLPPASSPAR
jgi:erythrin-vacuolar iron transport family protein